MGQLSFRHQRMSRDVIHRWEGNPLLRLENIGFMCADVHSAGVTLFENDALLLVTIEHQKGHQEIHLARCDKSGRFHVDREPFMVPRKEPAFAEYEERGVMDARVTFMEGAYYITYLANGRHGYRVGLARTRDFKAVEYLGLITEPDTKAGALFPEKIGGRYAMLSRPREGGSLWVSYSDDLLHWGGYEGVFRPRPGFWDSARVGTGAPPIKTEHGWLLIYYGVKQTSAGPLFRLGASFLDMEDPTKVICRCNVPILSPRERYERIGDIPNIVYCTGALIDGDDIHIFYGASDSCLCTGQTTLAEICETCMKSKEAY